MYHSFLLFLIGGCTLFLRSPLFESRKSLIIPMSLDGLCFIVADTVMVLERQHLGIEWTSLCGAEGDFICWLPSIATSVCLNVFVSFSCYLMMKFSLFHCSSVFREMKLHQKDFSSWCGECNRMKMERQRSTCAATRLVSLFLVWDPHLSTFSLLSTNSCYKFYLSCD